MEKQDLINRFVSYVTIDTQSDPKNECTRPSTIKQFDLLNKLEIELIQLGLKVQYDKDNGYIYAKLKSTKEKEHLKTVGFIAHVDTAYDMSGTNVKPKVIENYNGENIKLNEDYTLTTKDSPEILDYIGQTLITTSGDTLLGCDDKGGITIIMEAIKYIVNSDIEHGDICVAFTTDEEIGTGADNFDVEAFGADFAYTVDGGGIGELQFENFNAASVEIQITGKNVHPGDAKDKLINALEVAINFHNALPRIMRPEFTSGYEGFFFLHSMSGNTETANLHYLLREHGNDKFEKMITFINNIFNTLVLEQAIDGKINIQEEYKNMKEHIEPCFYIIDIAKKAMEQAGVSPKIEPIRGGTDGSKLSFMGLPCPNIFTGGHNFHSRYEYVCVESMLKGKQTLVNIVEILSNHS